MESILANQMEELDEEEEYEPKLILEDGSDMSEDEEDDLEEKHASLMASIKAMTQNDQKKVIERTIGSADVSEFGFNKTGGSKINIGDLISTLNTSNQAGKLKKQVKSIGNEKIADIPLEKPQQERLVRGIAYKAITEEVSKWQPLIQQNRKAEQLTFPLQQPNYSLKTSDEMTKRFQPRTPLEREIALLLHGSDNVECQTKMLTKAEERALKAMSLEEAKERRAELMKFRALMTYSETRFRRQKKIKSKGYRKILRKEKMKKEEKELDSLQKTDPEKYLEKIEYADKARVEERMSLKHRGGSKFARKKMMYARYDPEMHDESMSISTTRKTTMEDMEGHWSEEEKVKDLPRQFLNIKQFEQSISQPIGNTWNPEKAFHRMIQPKVVTQAGAIIKPIDKEEMFKKQKIDKKAGGDIDNKRDDKKRVVKGKNRNVKGSRKKH
ncbi:hypothetical protein LOTGIDRAFT_183349 [Lottia gigantea]|uniref:Uncharacterized protein n=1 Tax=Lottia gigantea TaxID=225164 RepID=V4A7N2_LOTGI|nr:hypothetical protein LOTGIDRAFT_183349 [Lottia gigantea]ESO89301.1 hypothetical protein LOTGIDRAFT_183349 [Lottia gigantea]